MATAKFHAIGNSSLWFRTRIQEEINAMGVEGGPIEVEQNKLAVIVEGSGESIERLYDNLRDASPEEVGFTKLVFDETKTRGERTLDSTTTDDMVEILKEIEKNTRKINQKLDAILAGGGIKTESSEWNSDNSLYGEKKEAEDSALDSTEDMISSFFDMQ